MVVQDPIKGFFRVYCNGTGLLCYVACFRGDEHLVVMFDHVQKWAADDWKQERKWRADSIGTVEVASVNHLVTVDQLPEIKGHFIPDPTRCQLTESDDDE